MAKMKENPLIPFPFCCLCFRGEFFYDADEIMGTPVGDVKFYVDDNGQKYDICLECKDYEDKIMKKLKDNGGDLKLAIKELGND